MAGAPGARHPLGLQCSRSRSRRPTSSRTLHDRLLREGLALLAERGVTGKEVTPLLLEQFHAGSDGASLRTNLSLVKANAQLAAAVAVALATEST